MTERPPDTKIWKIAAEVVSRPVGDEVVVLDLASSQYHGIDGVGVRVWPMLTEGATIEEIVDQLLCEYEVEEDRLRSDVEEFVAELAAAGLVVVVD